MMSIRGRNIMVRKIVKKKLLLKHLSEFKTSWHKWPLGDLKKVYYKRIWSVKKKGRDGFPYVHISELNRIVLAWVLFVKVANGYALLMGHDIKVLLILNFFQLIRVFLYSVRNLYHIFKNCCRPVCIDHTYINCWFIVHR